MNGRLVRLVPLTASWIAASSQNADFPDDNLADLQPKVVWQSAALAPPTTVTIDIDLQADTTIDTVALLFGNWSAAATWEARGTTSATGTGGLASAANRILGLTTAPIMRAGVTSRATRFHALVTGAAATVRYVRIIINETAANTDGLLRAGILAIGQSWAPAWNYEWGGGRRIDDLSDVTQLDGGEISVWRKARVPTVKLTWGDLSSAELAALYSLQLELGESEPLLLIEDPDPTIAGLHERIHYGLFQGLDFYERVQVEKSRVELRLRQWL